MAENFNEQDLQALFNRHLPHRPMPPDFAERLKQQVLAEITFPLKIPQQGFRPCEYNYKTRGF